MRQDEQGTQDIRATNSSSWVGEAFMGKGIRNIYVGMNTKKRRKCNLGQISQLIKVVPHEEGDKGAL